MAAETSREIGKPVGVMLRRIENNHYNGLREIGAESFRAETFIATAAEEEGSYFFFIGDMAVPYQRLV